MNNFKYVNSKSGVLKVASQQEKIPQSDEKLCLYHSRKICPEKGNTGIFFEHSLTIKDSQNFEYLSMDLVLYFQYLKEPSTLIVEDSLANLSCSIMSRILIDKVLCEYWNQFYGGVLKTPFVIR